MVFISSLVDYYFFGFWQQVEVDGLAFVFFVVVYELQVSWVVVGLKGSFVIMGSQVIGDLLELNFWQFLLLCVEEGFVNYVDSDCFFV